MISGFLAVFILISQSEVIQCSLGEPVTVDYSIPADFQPLPLEATDDFFLLEQNGDSVTIVPMVLDTLLLPPMSAVSDTIEIEFQPPVLEVLRTMPDTTWNVSVFPSPISHTIPPGFPEDYLDRHRFWERWGRAPSNTWLLLLIISLVLITAGILILIIRKKRKMLSSPASSGVSVSTLSPLDEVQALLDSKAFADGRWPEYYRDIDRLLRATVAFRFNVSNRAHTWHQIARLLSGERDGRKFLDDSMDLTREITLQRYASWGGSRERARRYTTKLLSLRKDWHRK